MFSKENLLMSDLVTLLSCALYTAENKVSQPLERAATKLKLLFHNSCGQCSSSSRKCCLSVSSLSLKQQNQQQLDCVSQTSKDTLEVAAAHNLGRPLQVPRNELHRIPIRLLWNLSKSLMHLIDSRWRSSVLALIQQSRERGVDESLLKACVRKLLPTSQQTAPPITPTTIITTFRILACPELVQENQFISPIIMEAVVDVNISGTIRTVKFGAQGTMTCEFSNSQLSFSPSISWADIKIDTSSLLQDMMKQARIFVREAVSIAFGIQLNNSSNPVQTDLLLQQKNEQPEIIRQQMLPFDPNHVIISDCDYSHNSSKISTDQMKAVANNWFSFGDGDASMPPPQNFGPLCSSLWSADTKLMCPSTVLPMGMGREKMKFVPGQQEGPVYASSASNKSNEPDLPVKQQFPSSQDLHFQLAKVPSTRMGQHEQQDKTQPFQTQLELSHLPCSRTTPQKQQMLPHSCSNSLLPTTEVVDRRKRLSSGSNPTHEIKRGRVASPTPTCSSTSDNQTKNKEEERQSC